MTPSVQVKDFDLYMIDVEEKGEEEKIHINTMCMCITYRISFVCGLTNPSEKERINNNQCAQFSTKPPILAVVLVQRTLSRVNTKNLNQQLWSYA